MATSTKDRGGAAGTVPDHVDRAVDVLDGGAPSARQVGILGHIWGFFISMRTGLVIILILGALTLAGTLLMQASSEVMADPAAYQQWYDMGPKQKYGGWAQILSVLGLFHVFSTWYFQGLFALLALSILACSINRAPNLWRLATRPKISMNDAFYAKAPLSADFELGGGVDAAVARVKDVMKGAHYRVIEGQAKKGVDLYADKNRWGPFGTVMAHLSFVIILAGFVVSGAFGFKESSFIAPVGVPVAVGHDTGLTVEAKSFTDSYYPDGTPKDYVSDLVLTKNGAQVARQETRVNSPLIYDEVWFHQAAFGVGADLTVTKGGTTLYSGTVPLQYGSDDGKQSFGQLQVPNTTITVWVIQAASGQTLTDLPAGSTALEIHPDATTDPTVQVLSTGKSTTVGEITYTYNRNRQYTMLSVNRDPGSWLVWIGSTLLILGSFLVFFLPHRRIWIRVRPTSGGAARVQLGAAIKRDPAFEPVFETYAARIESPDATVAAPKE